MARVKSFVVSLATLLMACQENELQRLDDLGDPCRSANQICLDDETVRACEANIWVARDCASVCAELGPAYTAAGCEFDCICVLVDPSGCTPGETTCVDDATVGVCDDTQNLHATPCSEVCTDAGLSEVGCLEDEDGGNGDCWCTREGTACEPLSTPTCVDNATVAVCEAGIWTFIECSAVCGGSGVCDPYQQAAACDCGR